MAVRVVQFEVVKVCAGETAHGECVQRAFDLLPWADPYIASLVESVLRSEAERPAAERVTLARCRRVGW